MKKRAGVSAEALADALGEPEVVLDEPAYLRPGADEFQQLLDDIGLDDDDVVPAEPDDVDEYTLRDRLPQELRPLFTAFLKRERAGKAPAQPQQGQQQVRMSPEVETLLRQLAEERRSQRKAEEPVPWKAQLPEPLKDAEPFFQDFVTAHQGELTTVKGLVTNLTEAVQRLQQTVERRDVEQTFTSIKDKYGQDFEDLKAKAGTILEENPELAMSPKGIARAFGMAKRDRDLEILTAEIKALRRGGAVPTARVGRAAGRRPAYDLSKVKGIEDAAKVAIRQMREMGFGDIEI